VEVRMVTDSLLIRIWLGALLSTSSPFLLLYRDVGMVMIGFSGYPDPTKLGRVPLRSFRL
jgi:hypothetical protein